MPSTKQRRRAKRHAERLVEEAIEAAAADELPLAEKLIQRALSAGPANAGSGSSTRGSRGSAG